MDPVIIDRTRVGVLIDEKDFKIGQELRNALKDRSKHFFLAVPTKHRLHQEGEVNLFDFMPPFAEFVKAMKNNSTCD